jgi:hypothetical protein
MKKKHGGQKSVPPKGHSPKVPKNANTSGVMRGGSGETGRAKPPGLNKTGPKRGNP